MAGLQVHTSSRVNGFLHFSRSQRNATAVLIVFCLLFWVSLRFFSSGNNSLILEGEWIEVAELENFVAQQEAAITFSKPKRTEGYTHSKSSDYRKSASPFNKGKLFAFDPNTITLEKLQELGLSERTAMNVINYREKGGRFRKPEDLKKLYSLKPEDAQRLIPFVQIPEAQFVHIQPNHDVNAIEKIKENATDLAAAPASKPERKERLITEPIDINLADSFSLTLLPGIGAKRAGAICRYRDRLGGFATVDQIAETYGLPDSVFQQILPYITLGNGPANKLCLNKATEIQLKNHPYIGWQMAKIIVAYRNQHGNFNAVEDLAKIYAVKKDWLEKVKPFLKTES